MWTWHSAIIIILFTLMQLNSSLAQASKIWQKSPPNQYQSIRIIEISFASLDILHSVLGLPSECVHNNIVRTCTLSFSCWIQGGRYAKGCGDNKWLFSCCVPEPDSSTPYYDNEVPTRFTIVKIKSKSNFPLPQPPQPPISVKQNMLRRRIDDDAVCQS